MIRASLVGLGMAVIVAIIIIAIYQSNSGVLRWPLTFGTRVLRLRYCLLLCAAPALLGLIAWANPNMLQALLLVREDSAFWDIFNITLISCFTVGVGLAMCRLVELHGGKRFADVTSLLTTETVEPVSNAAAVNDQQVAQGWSWIRIGLWWALGLVLPAFILLTARNEGMTNTRWLLAGTLAGWAAANLVALFVAGLERWLLGHIPEIANAGILPFEECVNGLSPWKIGSWNVPGRQISKWLFGDPNAGFSWLLRGPGYTDAKTGVLLPGQAQVLILVAFSAVVYLSWYYVNLSDQTWARLGWPSGFFAVLLLFLIGFFMSGLAFWLDRYGLPPVVFAVLYTVTVFYFKHTDHYFEVDVAPASQLPKTSQPSERGNAYVTAATTPPGPGETYEQLYWADVLKEWPFPEVNGQKTLVVVTASGGGIQAAAWTAKVLTELDREIPGLSQSIGLVSAVSGGSVGTMFYLGHRGLIEPSRADLLASMLPTQAARDAITNPSEQSSLEAVSWGVAFPDFVRTVVPSAAPRFIDRGWALESWWWNSMGGGLKDRELMRDVTIRDLIPLIAEHRLPPVVFNATCVETGQRVQISPLHVAVARDEDANDAKLVSTPIDFLEYYDAALGSKTGSNLRVSTAVRLSATFSYVTPVARPWPPQGFSFAARLQQMLLRVPETEPMQRRLNNHFCDGGYADNPGLVTAVRSIHELLEHYQRTKTPPPFQQVLVIRIEPFPKTAAQHAKDNDGFQSAVHGPSTALSATRVSTQAERSELELRLLEDATYSLERRHRRAWTQGLAELQKLHEQLPEQHGAKAEIKKIVNRAIPGTEPDNKIETSPGKRSLVPDASSLAELVGSLKQLDVPENLKSQLRSVQDHLNSAMESMTTALSPSRDRTIVPVHSVTFRFEVYPQDRPATPTAMGDEPIEPPLTWTLTESQKKDLDIAWNRIRSKRWKELNLDTADTISPAGIGQLFFTPAAGGKTK